MTAPAPRRRWLCPGVLVPVGDHLWAVDELQPVAAVLDQVTGELLDVVSWADVPPGPEPFGRVVLPAADGLWVQQPGGPLVLVGRDGRRSGHYVGDLTLAVVSAHGAWCAEASLAAGWTVGEEDEDDDGGYAPSQLRLARPGQVSRTVTVDGTARSLRSDGHDLFVEVVPGRRLGTTAASPEDDVPGSWLRLPADEEPPATLDVATHGCDTALVPLPDELADDDDRPLPDARVGEVDWFVGQERARGWTPRPVVAVGVPAGVPAGEPEALRGDLGTGVVGAVTATGSHLWVAVHRPRRRSSAAPTTAVAVLRVDGSTGAVTEVLGPESVDLDGRGWPLGLPPVDAEDYAAYCRDLLRGLDHLWTDAQGAPRPLSEGMSETRAEVVGTWPDACVEVTFAWERRPGLRLRRTVRMYDDLGQVDDPEYADVQIMEDLETGRVPPASYAESGVLDF